MWSTISGKTKDYSEYIFTFNFIHHESQSGGNQISSIYSLTQVVFILEFHFFGGVKSVQLHFVQYCVQTIEFVFGIITRNMPHQNLQWELNSTNCLLPRPFYCQASGPNFMELLKQKIQHTNLTLSKIM